MSSLEYRPAISRHSSSERSPSIIALPCASRSTDTRSQSSAVTRPATFFDEVMDITFLALAFTPVPPAQEDFVYVRPPSDSPRARHHCAPHDGTESPRPRRLRRRPERQ